MCHQKNQKKKGSLRFFFSHRIGSLIFPRKSTTLPKSFLVGRSNRLVQHLTHKRGLGAGGVITPLFVGTRLPPVVCTSALSRVCTCTSYIPSSGVGFVLDGVTCRKGVKRGEGVTHGRRSYMYMGTNRRRLGYVCTTYAAKGGNTYTQKLEACRGAHTCLGGNRTYVLTTLPPWYYLSNPPSPAPSI